MAYYADQSWGNNQYNPMQMGQGPGGMAPVGRDSFQTNPLFGGNSAYYDTANNGQIGYEQFVNKATGQGGNDSGGRFGNWLRSRFNTVNNQYGAAQGQDPSLKFTDFLTNSQDKLQQQYLGQNAYDKGEQGQKQMKWL